MIMNHGNLARKNLDKRLAPLRGATLDVPPRGWIRAIREALGLTTRQLAERMSVTQSRIPALEKAEANGATTLNTLRHAAAAMNCTLVYAFVPVRSLDETVADQAARKADAELARLHHTMQLENQAMTAADLVDERMRLIGAFVAGSPHRLWDAE
jgi:predicted DNA-binding mobile mystery protein A